MAIELTIWLEWPADNSFLKRSLAKIARGEGRWRGSAVGFIAFAKVLTWHQCDIFMQFAHFVFLKKIGLVDPLPGYVLKESTEEIGEHIMGSGNLLQRMASLKLHWIISLVYDKVFGCHLEQFKKDLTWLARNASIWLDGWLLLWVWIYIFPKITIFKQIKKIIVWLKNILEIGMFLNHMF